MADRKIWYDDRKVMKMAAVERRYHGQIAYERTKAVSFDSLREGIFRTSADEESSFDCDISRHHCSDIISGTGDGQCFFLLEGHVVIRDRVLEDRGEDGGVNKSQ